MEDCRQRSGRELSLRWMKNGGGGAGGTGRAADDADRGEAHPEKAQDIIEEMALGAGRIACAIVVTRGSEGVLEEMPNREANEVRELLAVRSIDGGGMMNTEFVFVSEDPRGEEVLE